MPVSTMTSKGQTTVPKEVRDALDLEPGAKLTWEVAGGRVAVSTKRPLLWALAGSVKGGPDDPVQAVAEARKRRGRI
ncbi:MAG: prlF antitoxin for toxin YhaV toxin [Thermoanaerobaculia bacterium]|jgi:AbrB family looped-hinge helix DNA binding protein|nr:prlF antitoxin for toxin YhaV toxin [Thermoanaerobaculia bacterium]